MCVSSSMEAMSSSINRTFLLEMYDLVIRTTSSCFMGTAETDCISNELSCLKCARDWECQGRGDCCPFEYPKMHCTPMAAFTSSLYPSTSGGVYMIDRCPEHANESMVSNCHQNVSKYNFHQLVPVTDTNSNITYRSQGCAVCNRVNQFKTWGLETDCQMDLNLFSSAAEIWNTAESLGCEIRYKAPIMEIFQCHLDKWYVNRCNVTGQWNVYNSNIEWGCINTYDPFDVFRNVYCYLCNINKIPSRCASDQQHIVNSSLNGHNSLTEINNGFHLSSIVSNLTDSVVNISKKYKNNRIVYDIKIYQLDYCKIIRTTFPEVYKFMKERGFCIVQNYGQNPMSTENNIFKPTNQYLNFANILKHAFVIEDDAKTYTGRLSKNITNITNTIFGNESISGLCDLRCYDTNYFTRDRCCLEKVLKGPISCIADAQYGNKALPMVSVCPRNSDKTLRDLCETFSSGHSALSIPVYSEKLSVTFKNVFCLLCYEATLQGYGLTLQSTQLAPWGFSMNCRTYVDTFRISSLQDLLIQAKDTCTITKTVYLPGTKNNPCRGKAKKSEYIDSCNATGKWKTYDKDLEYLCLETIPLKACNASYKKHIL